MISKANHTVHHCDLSTSVSNDSCTSVGSVPLSGHWTPRRLWPSVHHSGLSKRYTSELNRPNLNQHLDNWILPIRRRRLTKVTGAGPGGVDHELPAIDTLPYHTDPHVQLIMDASSTGVLLSVVRLHWLALRLLTDALISSCFYVHRSISHVILFCTCCRVTTAWHCNHTVQERTHILIQECVTTCNCQSHVK